MKIFVWLFGYDCVVWNIVFYKWYFYCLCVEYLYDINELDDVVFLYFSLRFVEMKWFVGWWEWWRRG